MSNVIFLEQRKTIELDMPEDVTIIKLALMGKVWARVGYREMGPGCPTGGETVFFIEKDGWVHAYQKGCGVNDHLLFWSLAMKACKDVSDRILDTLFQGCWEDEG